MTEAEEPVEEREGHSRRMHFNCAMNNAQSTDTNVVGAVEAPTVVKCCYCSRGGHSRRIHFNCAMNSDKLHPGPYVFVLKGSEGPKNCGKDVRPRQRDGAPERSEDQ